MYFELDSGCVCGDHPNMKVPMAIAKNKPKPFKGFIPPPGMVPQVLGNCALEVPPYKNAKKAKARKSLF